jgi:hypothetical protein
MPQKIKSEKDTITSILADARKQGVEDKVIAIIQKYEQAVKGARTIDERNQIAACGLAEIHRTVGYVGALVVNGVEIIPEQTGYNEVLQMHKRVNKID